MTIYTEGDLLLGQGAFERAAEARTTLPGRATRMTQGVAIGTLSAAIRSGVPAKLIDQMIEQDFGDSASLLKRVLGMYEGDDWDISLWHRQSTGFYKLATALCRPGQARWRYDPSSTEDEF